MSRTHRIAILIAGTALIAGAQAATADVRVHIGGSARIHVGGGAVRGSAVRVRAPRAHWIRRHAGVRIRGSIWFGGGYYQPFAQPPPPPPPQVDCNCGQTYYPPIAPAPASYAVVAVQAPELAPLPRFGLGAYLGGVAVDGQHEGQDVGLVAQVRLSRGLLAEAEIAKNELDDGARIDRRLMAGLQLELRPRAKLSPYLAAAIGTSQVEVGQSWQDQQALAEIGAGLRYRLSDRISLFGDFRAGQRQLSNDGVVAQPVDAATARIVPASDESYTRARFGGLVTF